MSVASSVRVLVAAPSASLTALLSARVRDAGFTVVGERRRIEGPAALDAIDVVVVAAGTELSDAFAEGHPGVVVVGADPEVAERLTRDGARAVGVVLADADARTIGAAIGAVAAGLSVRPLDAAARDGFGDFPARRPTPRNGARDGIDEPTDVEPLTARESEVLDSLAQGLSNRAIAAKLGISEHTVKFHLASIFGKLGVTTRTGAVRRALRRGLIDL